MEERAVDILSVMSSVQVGVRALQVMEDMLGIKKMSSSWVWILDAGLQSVSESRVKSRQPLSAATQSAHHPPHLRVCLSARAHIHP